MFISCLSSVKQRCLTLLVSFLNQRQKVVNKSCHFYSNMSINRNLCFKINEAKIQFFSKWGNFLTSMGHGHGMDLIFTILSSFCIIKHELWHMLLFFYYFFNFYFYFILLYNTVLVLPYIDMNPPWVYMSSHGKGHNFCCLKATQSTVFSYGSSKGLRHDLNHKVERKDKKGRSEGKLDYVKTGRDR